MTIRRKTSAQLSDLTVVAQCLDNQWIPPELAKDVNSQHGFLGVSDRRNKAIRRELMGAILTSEQLIVNRAYAYTNEVLAEIYANRSESESLRKALDREAIVIFLAGERSLDDEVKFQVGEHHLAGNQLKLLQRLLESSDVPCLRFDWDDETTNKNILKNKLGRSFQEFVQTIANLDIKLLARDFNIPEDRQRAFRTRLYELAQYALTFSSPERGDDPPPLTRTDVYENFVTPEGRTIGGFIDEDRPFAREIKSLVDLKYNCNLPDALARFAVTSAGDIDRSVLQETRRYGLEHLEKFTTQDEDALLDLLTRSAFDEMSTFNSFQFLDQIDLSDALSLRSNPSWSEYADLVKRILPAKNSGSFEQHAIFDTKNLKALGEAHTSLLSNAARLVETRTIIEKVKGWWEISVQSAAVGLKMISEHHGTGVIEIPHELTGAFAEATSDIVVEMGYMTLDSFGQKRAVRKYPILKKRLEAPADMFRRTARRLEEYSKARSAMRIKTLTDDQYRANDRLSTLNLPET
ncbi:MAG: hypothetical protein U1E61_01760 [Bradyrhizobium sp.]